MMKLRMAEPKDLNQLVTLLRVLTDLEESFDFDEEAHRKGFALLIDTQPGSCVVVAETEEGRVGGTCTGQMVISTAQGGLSVWIDDVVVHPDFQRQGLGSDLLSFVEAWAQEQGAHRSQLLVDKDNPKAQVFYKNQNWQKTNFSCLRKLF